MALTDEEFREEYKPLQIHANYDPTDTQENKIIYSLAQLGEGSVTDVIGKMELLEPGILNAQLIAFVKTALINLFNKGLLTGHEKGGIMYYNFHKISQANDGVTNPDLLAPGLD